MTKNLMRGWRYVAENSSTPAIFQNGEFSEKTSRDADITITIQIKIICF